ncbi:cytochrome P450 [Aspergillus tanneri]|uniref:Cytochrome P450 n=1 Tax=Aspergillus tanneri TaxID=1220188 RepID=A0A5M9M9B2_9EURO|nr:uncharacterized protein ATNIH1004_011639 [Aspergillus tanneri]KAA8641503.1 hypothetical protein ATNIH1004_011639 [Aspergillus tanneri]
MNPLVQLMIAAVCGAWTHLAVFRRGEWERRAPWVAFTYLALEALWLFVLSPHLQVHSYWAISVTYFAALFSSMVVYRAFFHPLHNVPGPFKARITAFWSMWDPAFFRTVQRLHQQYGDFVRIRPREMSINHIDAVRAIHGCRTTCSKGPWYDFLGHSLQATRDKDLHSERRRVWDMGLNSDALKHYEPYIWIHCVDLIKQLSMNIDRPIPITEWVRFFSFDVMGEMVLGKSFQMVQNGKPHVAVAQEAAMHRFMGPMVHVTWLLIILQKLPFLAYFRQRWVDWCASQLEEREKRSRTRVDLFSYLLDSGAGEPKLYTQSRQDLTADADLAFVAGSDTTAGTLCALIYLLAKYPEKQRKLQKEVGQIVSSISDISHRNLQVRAPYLNSCIHEALRLFPNVPSGVQRLTPAEGMSIAGRWIPGNTLVSTPTYTLHRDERYFKDPGDFVPERWSSHPELVLHKEAFNPFLIGAYSCAGKSVAQMEMRMLMAALVFSFSFDFPEEEKARMSTILEGPELKETFVLNLPEIQMVFTAREERDSLNG